MLMGFIFLVINSHGFPRFSVNVQICHFSHLNVHGPGLPLVSFDVHVQAFQLAPIGMFPELTNCQMAHVKVASQSVTWLDFASCVPLARPYGSHGCSGTARC